MLPARETGITVTRPEPDTRFGHGCTLHSCTIREDNMALMHCHFKSKVLGLMSGMYVILPDPPMDDNGRHCGPEPERRPVLYLLHGLSDDHTVWLRRTSIERYVSSYNLAVVMPDVHRSFYTDTRYGQRYWTFISEELPALSRLFFPLSDAREDNYVAGLSMGGYGAFKLALSHPERYAAAASLSGALDMVGLVKSRQKEDLHETRHIFGEAGEMEGGPNDLFALAGRLAVSANPRPALYQWCGREDFLYESNLRFRDHAADIKMNVDFREGPGGHEWACWDRQIQEVLEWLPGLTVTE